MGPLAIGATAAGVAALAAAANYALPLAVKRIERAGLERMCQGVVALTYDDGPSRDTTPVLLDVLAESGAKATFFIKGCAIDAARASLDRVRDEGHEIASHSRDHLHAWRVGPFAAMRDLHRGEEDVAPWSNNPGHLRPPYGKWTLPSLLWMRARAVRAAWWTADSGDTHDPYPSPEHAAGLVDKNGGGVVLMHDLDKGEEHRRFVVDATRAVLDVAARRGFEVVTMGRLLRGETQG